MPRCWTLRLVAHNLAESSGPCVYQGVPRRYAELIALALQDHLYSGDHILRERAAEILSKNPSRAISLRLAQALRSPRDYVSTRAAWGLSLRGDAFSIHLLKKALHGRSPRALKQAAWALGRIDDVRARRELVAALDSPRRIVRNQAAAGLWRAAVNGFSSAAVEKKLLAMLPRDKGCAALTLSHMLRNRTRVPLDRRGKPTAFERHGGSWIR